MKAARLYGARDIRVEEVDEPDLPDGYGLIRVEACGVCPSDIRSFDRASNEPPWTPGHEVSGELVRAAGGQLGDIDIGERVVVDWRQVCGRCFYCLAGNPNFCEQREEFPIVGFAEYSAAPLAALHKLPPPLSFEEGSFCEPLACVLNAHRAMRLWPGQDFVVLGAGPIGLLHAQVALRRGARVIAVDLLQARLSIAHELGVHDVVDASKADAVAQVRDLTGGYGASAAVVAVGSTQALTEAMAMVRKGGVVNVFAGIYPSAELRLDPNVIHYGEISLTGSHDYGPAEFASALRLIEHGIIAVAPLVSHRFPLDEIVHAFTATSEQHGLKSIIQPQMAEGTP